MTERASLTDMYLAARRTGGQRERGNRRRYLNETMRPAWERTPEANGGRGQPLPQQAPEWSSALRSARVSQGMAPEATDQPLDPVALARLRGETLEQRYSPLSEDWGWLDLGAGLGVAAGETFVDSLASPFSEGARLRNDARRTMLRDAGEGFADALDSWTLDNPGSRDWDTPSNFWADRQGATNINEAFSGSPGQNRRADVQQTLADMDARSEGFWVEPDLTITAESRPDTLTRLGAVGSDLWRGPSEAARTGRREYPVYLALEQQAREAGDVAAADEYGRMANAAALSDAVNTGSGALEAAPEIGLVDTLLGLGRFTGRQVLRAAGREIPYYMNPVDWSSTAAYAGRADEAMLDPGMLTRQAEPIRNAVLAAPVGAVAADLLMDGDAGDANQLAGGALITGGAIAGLPMALRGGEEFVRGRLGRTDPLADIAPRVADDAPFAFEGAPQAGRVIDAEATPAPARNFEAAVRDPETGQVYRGQDHLEAIDSAPDEAVRARLQAAYDAVDEDPSIIGFQVDGEFMGREQGMDALRARAGRSRQVRIGEQVNRDGSVTPRSEIDWDSPNTRLPADDEWFNNLAGMPTPPRMNIVPDGGIPGRSADDMLRDVPDAGQARIGQSGAQSDLFPETAPSPERVFHGTTGDFDPEQIAPWSHFGTERAARHRLEAQVDPQFRDSPDGPNMRVLPYEITGRRIDVGREFDTPGMENSPKDIADLLLRGRHITPEEHAWALEPHQGGARFEGRNADEVIWERLSELADRHDIGAIGYQNAVEDAGSRSYLVPNPRNVRAAPQEAPYGYYTGPDGVRRPMEPPLYTLTPAPDGGASGAGNRGDLFPGSAPGPVQVLEGEIIPPSRGGVSTTPSDGAVAGVVGALEPMIPEMRAAQADIRRVLGDEEYFAPRQPIDVDALEPNRRAIARASVALEEFVAQNRALRAEQAARALPDGGASGAGQTFYRGVREGDALSGEGPIYLHRDPSKASEYAGARFDASGRPLIETTGEGGNVARVTANIRNPIEVSQQEIAALGYEPYRIREMMQRGYDAAIAPNGEVLVFDRNGVRPAIGRAPDAPNSVSRTDGGASGAGNFDSRVVYRGMSRPYDPANGGYYQSFTSSLDDAREYGSQVMAANIRPGRNLAIDGGGNNFNALSVEQLPADVRARLHPSVGASATTDQIAHAAREAGYDSVTVRNVHDNRWGERPIAGAQPRTIDFVFNTENIRPLDNVPPQAETATQAAEKVRLSAADRALLDELLDPDAPNAGNPSPRRLGDDTASALAVGGGALLLGDEAQAQSFDPNGQWIGEEQRRDVGDRTEIRQRFRDSQGRIFEGVRYQDHATGAISAPQLSPVGETPMPQLGDTYDSSEVPLRPEEIERIQAEREANGGAPPAQAPARRLASGSQSDNTTPAWALAAPLIAGIAGGRIGREWGMRNGRPVAGEVLGAAGAGSAAGAASGAFTDANAAGELTVLGSGLGLGGRGAYRLGEAGVRRGAEAVADFRLPAPRRVRGQPLPYVGDDVVAPMNEPGSLRPPPVRQPERMSGSLDEGDLSREMSGRAIEEGRRRLRPTPVTMEERLNVPAGERGSLEGRLSTLGAEPLRELARREGLSTEGTVRDLARRLADAARQDPAALERYRRIFQALGVSSLILGGASQLLPQDAEAMDGGEGLPSWSDEAGVGAAAFGLAVLGRTAAPRALEGLVPNRARLGQLSRVSELPMDIPRRTFDLDRSRLGRVAPNRVASDVDPRRVAFRAALAAGPIAWGAAELLDPTAQSPQEQDAAFLRNVMPYFELRQQALELYSQGYTSREIRDIDPEIADEMLILEQGGNSLLNDYEVSPAETPEDIQAARASRAREEQKRERQRLGR